MIFKSILIALALAIFIAAVEYFSIAMYQKRIEGLKRDLTYEKLRCKKEHFEDIWKERIEHNETTTDPDLTTGHHTLEF